MISRECPQVIRRVTDNSCMTTAPTTYPKGAAMTTTTPTETAERFVEGLLRKAAERGLEDRARTALAFMATDPSILPECRAIYAEAAR